LAARRAPESEPILGDDRSPRRAAQLFREVAPQVYTTERIVQQHDRYGIADRLRSPTLGVEAASGDSHDVL
jgi:hypothetical protein